MKAESTEDAVYQLLGLHWAGESAERLADLARALSSQQRADGGWAQLPKLESDAYATGQALHALSRAAKHPTTNRDWQQGLRFLCGTAPGGQMNLCHRWLHRHSYIDQYLALRRIADTFEG